MDMLYAVATVQSLLPYAPQRASQLTTVCATMLSTIGLLAGPLEDVRFACCCCTLLVIDGLFLCRDIKSLYLNLFLTSCCGSFQVYVFLETAVKERSLPLASLPTITPTVFSLLLRAPFLNHFVVSLSFSQYDIPAEFDPLEGAGSPSGPCGRLAPLLAAAGLLPGTTSFMRYSWCLALRARGSPIVHV